MKRKSVFAAAVLTVMLITMLSLGACEQEDKYIYDVGEYGQIRYSSTGGVDGVDCNEGYRFLGWSEPVKEGNKITYTAQYEHAEYYLTEVKDVYICPPNTYEGTPEIKRKITNMQTNEVKDENAPAAYYKVTSSDPRCQIYNGGDGRLVMNQHTQEFDSIATVTVDDFTYNLKTEFTMHFVRNRIKAESIEIACSGITNNETEIDTTVIMHETTAPKDTSFKSCCFTVLEVIRNGQALPQEEISDIAYFMRTWELHITDQAQAGDIIKIQAYNERDPEVKSNIVMLTVI